MTALQRTRMVVRLASLLLSLFFLLNIVQDTLSGKLHSMNLPFIVAFFPVTIACIAAWRWERQGGTAVILTGLLLGFAASFVIASAAAYQGIAMPYQTLAGLTWALPYVIFGVLFRAIAQREAKRAYGSM